MSSAPAPAGPSLAGRFAAAIALTIGFYVLALVIALALLAVAILPWLNGGGNIWLTITGLVLGTSILRALVPRRLRFTPAGPTVTEADEPRLLKLIAEEARAVDEPVPDDVYLTMEVNAAVTQASRTRRVLIVGLPLLHMLSERQFRGVMAHEFGHYRGGDLKPGPLIWRTRQAIGRTIEKLSDEDGDESWSKKLVRLPFSWYGKGFLRITAAISRREEFAADLCAVDRVGRDAHVEALRRIARFAPAFDGYWGNEVVPVLQAGRRPPVAAGFSSFMAAKPIAEAADEHLAARLKSETDPYDSHPSLPERIAAVESLPGGEPDDTPSALELLSEPAAAEHRVLEFLLGDEAADFTSVDWDEVGSEVYAERARALTEQFPTVVEGVTVGELPEVVERIPQLADELREPDVEPEYAANVVAATLGDGLLLALQSAGWQIEAAPGQPVSACREDVGLIPHEVVHRLRAGEVTAERWREQAAELGIAELPLGAHAAQPAAA